MPECFCRVLGNSRSCVFAFPCPDAAAPPPHSRPKHARCPRLLTFVVDKEIRRDKAGFTEGLEVHDGAFGNPPAISSATAASTASTPRPAMSQTAAECRARRYFGEGLTFFGGKLYQMTYREHRVFVFDAQMQPLPELTNPREGWGLTHDATQLDRQRRLRPAVLSCRRRISPRRRTLPVTGRRISRVRNINELEYRRRRDLGQCLRGLDPVEDFAAHRLRRGQGRHHAPARSHDHGGTRARSSATPISCPTASPMTRRAGPVHPDREILADAVFRAFRRSN